jgi:hypothetical protein
MFVANGRIRESEPRLLVVAFSIHSKRQILAVRSVTRHRSIDEGTDVVPDLGPDGVEWKAQRAGMLVAEHFRVSVVVEETEGVATRRTSECASGELPRRSSAATLARIAALQAGRLTNPSCASAHRLVRRRQEIQSLRPQRLAHGVPMADDLSAALATDHAVCDYTLSLNSGSGARTTASLNVTLRVIQTKARGTIRRWGMS